LNALGEILGEIQLTSEQQLQNGNFDLDGYAPGLYILKIVDGKNIYLKKLIKQ
jgi:hypothetical protein